VRLRASIQPWTVCSDRPTTFPRRVSIISLSRAALRWRSSLIESTPISFSIAARFGPMPLSSARSFSSATAVRLSGPRWQARSSCPPAPVAAIGVPGRPGAAAVSAVSPVVPGRTADGVTSLPYGLLRGLKQSSLVSANEHGDHVDVHRWTGCA
jgi:hypothetical protein